MDLDDTELLHLLAERADGLSLPAWRSKDYEVEIKPDGSPVTTIDEAIEESLLALVAEHRPGDGFLGEEVGAHPGTGRLDRTWVVDGIDGTRNFVAGKARWSTLIALVVDGVPVAGAATSPSLGKRWSTTADGGAEVTGGDRMTVSATAALAQARIAVWPAEGWAEQLLAERHTALLDLLGTPQTASTLVDAPIPHGAIPVADGRLDAMVAFSGQAWDHAGPSAIVTAAGGRSGALDGSPAFDTGAAVFSNGLLHDELIAVLGAG